MMMRCVYLLAVLAVLQSTIGCDSDPADDAPPAVPHDTSGDASDTVTPDTAEIEDLPVHSDTNDDSGPPDVDHEVADADTPTHLDTAVDTADDATEDSADAPDETDADPCEPNPCDDGNPCTADLCDPTIDGLCLPLPIENGTACSDDDQFACQAGLCVETPVPCGNGSLDLGEACDPGPDQPGDACSADCQVEVPVGMVAVAAGPFWMGCITETDGACNPDEQPAREVWLPLFAVDVLEATNADWAKCVAAGKCAEPAMIDDVTYGKVGLEQHPVTGMSHTEAAAYCAWQGKRLPTEAEWEKAARSGCDPKDLSSCAAAMPKYATGKAVLSCADAAVGQDSDGTCGLTATIPVGSMANDVSGWGVRDLTGNVEEWTADGYEKDAYAQASKFAPFVPLDVQACVRGGHWQSTAQNARAARRAKLLAAQAFGTTGVRCAHDLMDPCDDGNGCTLDWSPKPGTCEHEAQTDGSCDDGSACTSGDSCQVGSCQPGTAVACDDGNTCTTDACDPAQGCAHAATAGACADGNACTQEDLCSGDECKAGAAKDCSDANACTSDSCDPQTGVCANAALADGTPCGDGVTCSTGKCQVVAPCGNTKVDAGETCDDGNQQGGDGCDANCVTEVSGMVAVLPGPFWMGLNTLDFSGNPSADVQPLHEVQLSLYWIDQHEVTIDAYAACVTAGKCSAPVVFSADDPTAKRCNWQRPDAGTHPVNCVTFQQAESYCTWKGKVLPTEAQWEKAARGGCEKFPGQVCKDAAPSLPWGTALGKPLTCKYAVIFDLFAGGDGCGTGGTWPVGSKPDGASPYGAHDMAGNVLEFVKDLYDANYYAKSPAKDPVNLVGDGARAVRGGSYATGVPYLWARFGLFFDQHPTVGLRCATSAP
jgi:iron(II)-dependent oxidoreductase